MSEPIYMFRRKGQDAFCTCDAERYAELSNHSLFEVGIAYSALDYDALSAECERMREDRDQQYDMKVKAREQRDAMTAENEWMRADNKAMKTLLSRVRHVFSEQSAIRKEVDNLLEDKQ